MKSKALIIDDDQDLADSLATLLATRGYEVKVEHSPEAGIIRAAIYGPHLVLLDVLMPAIHGVEAAVRIRKLLPRARILLISGDPEAVYSIIDGQPKAKHFKVLEKPIPPATLFAMISKKKKSQRNRHA